MSWGFIQEEESKKLRRNKNNIANKIKMKWKSDENKKRQEKQKYNEKYQ